jgi:hypothetical protein
MQRRHFLWLSLSALACNGETVQSVVKEPVPGDGLGPWPDSQVDVPVLDEQLGLALQGTPLDDIEGLALLADMELRALARTAPETAGLLAAGIDTIASSGLLAAGELSDEALGEDQMGSILASNFDLYVRKDALLSRFEAAGTELEGLAAETVEGNHRVATTLRDLASTLRKQLHVAGREDNTFARQMLKELDLLAEEVETVSLADALTGAKDALETAEEQPPAPPWASLCTSIHYISQNVDRRRATILGLMKMVATTAWMTHSAIAAAWACAADITDCPEEIQDFEEIDHSNPAEWSVSIVPGGAIPLLVGIGVIALLMPFYLYRPPTVYEPIHYRMCDCLGN